MKKRIIKITFIVIIIALFLQIPLRHYKGEPYPAILLPAGAGVIKDRGFITHKQDELMAVTVTGKQYKVSVNDLLNTIPTPYREYIIRHKFGLPTNTNSRGKTLSKTTIKKGRAWLRNRLVDILGPDDFVSLKITRYRTVRPTRDLTRPHEMQVLRVTEILLR